MFVTSSIRYHLIKMKSFDSMIHHSLAVRISLRAPTYFRRKFSAEISTAANTVTFAFAGYLSLVRPSSSCVIVRVKTERLTLRPTERNSFSELSEWCLSVDGVVSLLRWNWLVSLAAMVLAERLVHTELVNSHWSVSICLFLVKSNRYIVA